MNTDSISIPDITPVSFISSLPPEIILEIMICAHNVHREFCQSAHSPHDIPVHLTQICSSWRRLALHTLELWSFVGLVLDYRRACATRAIIQFVDSCLVKGRRGNLALDIYMGFEFYDLDDDLTDMSPIGRLLATHACDWRRLTLNIITASNENATGYIIGCLSQNLFPSLE